MYAEQHHDIPEQVIWQFLVDLLLAVQHLHRRHLVHMDIKPDNIFISFDGVCKLGDFGLIIDLNKVATFSLLLFKFLLILYLLWRVCCWTERPERGARGRPEVSGARGARQQQQHQPGGGHIQPGHDHTRAGDRLGLAARRRLVAPLAQQPDARAPHRLAQPGPCAHHTLHDRARPQATRHR